MVRLRSRLVPRAFTLVDLLFVLLALALLAGILLPSIGRSHRHGTRYNKDGAQVRGVHQGLVLFAQSNKDRYPLPSELDVDDYTIAAPAETKDTTGSIFSVLIFQNFFTPELCVSPSDVNPAIHVDAAFEYTTPSTAANPAKALWDPGFNADFTLTNPKRSAAFSYAHLMPFDQRREKWSDTFDSNTAIIANRGPLVSSVAKLKRGDVSITLASPPSNSLLIHGGRSTWEGNVAYNDNSISFETSMAPETKLWSTQPLSTGTNSSGGNTRDNTGPSTAAAHWRDVLFYDEPDDPNGTNNYLVNVVGSGKAQSSRKVIWD